MIKQIFQSVVDLIYPPLCLHCKEGVANRAHLFCKSCMVHFTKIDPSERCPFCFSTQYDEERKVCERCKKHPPTLNRLAAAFDYVGPAATLVKSLKYSRQESHAKLLASYLVAQSCELNWPMPDFIIPVPISLNRRMQRGFNQSELIAKHLSEMLQVPLISPLGRKSGDFSQAGLNERQRMLLSGDSFYLKSGYSFYNKRLIIIDDVMTTGTTLKRCAETLYEACPDSIYGLTVCRGIK